MSRIPREVQLGRRLLGHWAKRADDARIDVIKLKLFITKRCNLDCVHCGIGGAGFDGADELSSAEVLALWAANPRLQMLSLSGGEPFLRDDLCEVALAAARLPKLMALSVNTNGWYSDAVLDLARRVGPAMGRAKLYLAISSDGPPEAHARVRRSEDSWARKEDTLARLRAAAIPNVVIRHNVNVNRWNLDEVVPYIEANEARGEACFVSMYSASRHYSHGAGHHRELRAFREELSQQQALLRRLQDRPGFLPNRFLVLAEDFYETVEREQPVPCFSLRASLIVEHDGMVRPCINFPVDLGRVQEHGFDLEAIASGPKANTLRETIREERCPICWTPNEAFVTMMCNLPNPDVWKDPRQALVRLGRLKG